MYSDCSDGDLRLAGERTAVSGRLEICYNKAWGTVCNNAWGSDDSRVACRQLGFQPYGENALNPIYKHVLFKINFQLLLRPYK